MVRTKANNAAVRKGKISREFSKDRACMCSFCFSLLPAVVAKAPRKNISVAGRTNSCSPTSGISGKRKGKIGGSGNSLKLWPIPKGQKGLQSFISELDGEAPPPSRTRTPTAGASSSGVEEESTINIQGEGSAGSSSSLEGSSSMHMLLDKDITQLNSESEGEEEEEEEDGSDGN